jgi:hypothetical protein
MKVTLEMSQDDLKILRASLMVCSDKHTTLKEVKKVLSSAAAQLDRQIYPPAGLRKCDCEHVKHEAAGHVAGACTQPATRRIRSYGMVQNLCESCFRFAKVNEPNIEVLS